MVKTVVWLLTLGAAVAASGAGQDSASTPAWPPGFQPIFDGRTTSGWHWSRTVHHGTTAIARVEDGVLVLQPHPFGQGGLWLTDKVYRDFDLYLECLPDPGANSGIFLRSTEGGSAYQIELVRPGHTGALLGEQMHLSTPRYLGPRTDVNTVWKDGGWNAMRVRMQGEAPHITLWINDTKMWEVAMPRNDQIGGRYGGHIGLQLHWSATYTAAAGGSGSGLPWSVQRFRHMAIQELP
jgi:3-keto-disaccharide hydrolase